LLGLGLVSGIDFPVSVLIMKSIKVLMSSSIEFVIGKKPVLEVVQIMTDQLVLLRRDGQRGGLVNVREI